MVFFGKEYKILSVDKEIFCPYCIGPGYSGKIKKFISFLCFQRLKDIYLGCLKCFNKLGNKKVNQCPNCLNVLLGQFKYCAKCKEKIEFHADNEFKELEWRNENNFKSYSEMNDSFADDFFDKRANHRRYVRKRRIYEDD